MLDSPLLYRIIRMGRNPYFLQKGYKETAFSKIKEIYLISPPSEPFPNDNRKPYFTTIVAH